MPRLQRLIAASVLFALSAALAGCGTNGSFDPSDLLDFLDQKKKLPGDRKPVFPDGVPGIEQGVPKELYKGANAQQQDQPPVIEPTPAPAPKKKPAAKMASRAKPAPKPAEAPAAADPDASGPDGEEGMAAAPPAPPPPKTKRTRATALPKDQPSQPSDPSDQQQAASPFPAPLPR
jgi:hypothetical protein